MNGIGNARIHCVRLVYSRHVFWSLVQIETNKNIEN